MVTAREATMGINGMVATPHYLASQAGLKVLRDGGNAVDAAIAANAVLTVVMPDSCSIGGDAFFMIWDPSAQEVVALNGSGRAGAGLTVDAVRSAGHDLMPERGPLTVTVPGAINAWATMLERYGTRELGSVLSDAIQYAREGFPITPRLHRAIQTSFLLLGQNEAAARQFLPSGTVPPAGSVLRQPALATSLQAIARHGPAALYGGVIGQRLAKDVARHGGALTEDDLSAHSSNWVQPLRGCYRDVEVLEMPPNTQGVTALQMLQIADGWTADELPLHSADQVHHFVEAKKLAFADRDQCVGDPDFVDVPVERLLSQEYAAELRSQIDPQRARVNQPDPAGGGDTIYLCTFDSDGLAVSLIQSLFRGFGSGIVAEGTGIVLQNRGASFSLEDGHANRLEPGKRPMHTLIPGLVMKDGRPWSVFGTMGGHGQAQTHLQLINKMVDFGLDPQQAIDSPRWVAGRNIETDPEHLLRIEPEFDEAVIQELRDRGHEVLVTESLSQAMGHAQAIRIDWENGVLYGGADPRADGCALAW